MLRVANRALAALAAACLPAGAIARPFTIDDLLHQQTFGAQAVDPSGRWIVFEQRDPYDRGRRFDGYLHTSEALTRLRLVDLRRPGAARPLLRIDPGPGETLGAFSPSGARLAIYRLHGASMSLGVVTVATGAVRWWPITPERPNWGRGLQWLSDRELLVIARPDGVPSWAYREGRASAARLPALWAASAAGAAGRTVVGSGVYAGVRPRPTPRQLLRVDVTSGATRRLARGEFLDLEVSPEGRRVALLESGPDVQPRADGPAQGLAGISDQEERLSLLDLRSGVRVFPCPHQDVAPHLLSWSPSGGALAVFARPAGGLWTAGRLLKVDAASGATAPLGEGLQPVLDLRPEIVRTGWMAEDPIVLARDAAPGARGRADWYRLAPSGPVNLTHGLPQAPRVLSAVADTGFTAILGDAVWRVTASGEATRLTAEPAVSASARRTTAGTQRLDLVPPRGSWVATGENPERRLQWLDAQGLTPLVALPADTEPELVASRSPKAALVSEVDPQGVTRLRLLTPGRPARLIAEINRAWAGITPPRVRAVKHPGPDGQALTSWLFLPPHTARVPPPLVVQVYSGATYPAAPRDYPGERGFLTNVRMLVGHGYAVLVASLPLPKDHHDPMAGLGARIGAVVDAAAADPKTSGSFDAARVALWGHSYGGYTVMAAIAQTHRFRAAVSIAGLSDLISKWETMPAVYRAAPEEGLHNNWSSGSVESGQDGMETPPWIDPARYVRNSPLFVADRIDTPLMLVHGDQDVIPLPQSEAMFSALYRQDKDAVLVTYWGEGHVITSPGNVRDLYRRAFAFLDEQLLARPNAPVVVEVTGSF